MSDPAHPLKGLKVAFVHPDLGIGGAENLVVNAAVALQKKGHEITMYTAHHDKSHCFPETTGDGVLAAGVVVYGDWLPRHIFLRLHVAFAIIRMIYVSIIVVFFGDHDVIFVDQVSHCIPILRLSGKPVLFYCHYPDKLLCTERSSALKRLYRAPVDWLEEKTTEAADKIVVNSKFTASVFKTAFGSIAVEPGILYPPINVDNFVPPSDDLATAQKAKTDIFDWAGKDSVIILSINRFERKKNIALAVQALAQMKNTLPAKEFAQIHLVLAGKLLLLSLLLILTTCNNWVFF
jgi:glycosyltransferase involved in cell wall biosynthesis